MIQKSLNINFETAFEFKPIWNLNKTIPFGILHFIRVQNVKNCHMNHIWTSNYMKNDCQIAWVDKIESKTKGMPECKQYERSHKHDFIHFDDESEAFIIILFVFGIKVVYPKCSRTCVDGKYFSVFSTSIQSKRRSNTYLRHHNSERICSFKMNGSKLDGACDTHTIAYVCILIQRWILNT